MHFSQEIVSLNVSLLKRESIKIFQRFKDTFFSLSVSWSNKSIFLLENKVKININKTKPKKLKNKKEFQSSICDRLSLKRI